METDSKRTKPSHWLSKEKVARLRNLYQADPEQPLRELGGIVWSDMRGPTPDQLQRDDDYWFARRAREALAEEERRQQEVD